MKQYSFYDVDLLIDGAAVSGFPSTRAIITARRNAPQHAPTIDAYGKMTMTTSADHSGTISFPLLQTADWNQILYERAQLTQATGLSGNKSLWEPIQIQIVDKMGDVQVSGINGAILKQPDIVRGTELNTNMWSLFVERINFTTGVYPEIGV